LELTLTLEDASTRGALFGAGDCNLKLIRAALGVQISARDSLIKVVGSSSAVTKAAQVIRHLQQSVRKGRPVTKELVSNAIAVCAAAEAQGLDNLETIEVYARDNLVVPKTDGQRRYVEAMASHDLTFCLGPAGTGKTYLAVAVAVSLLKRGALKRIILVRPAVEAGEKLGYLPGDMQAKVNPYLRPIFDAMHDMMSFEQLKRFMQNDVVEVVPLAFMRGRTLNNAAVILDEAQNTTVQQMLMFLTRLGHHSKMIVTGDDSQVDLESGRSGLVDAEYRLKNIKGIAIVRLYETDIVRHKLVQKIVSAYDKNASRAESRSRARRPPDSRTRPEGVDPNEPSADDAFDRPDDPEFVP
jgi:phosphate starvation-inducible PhoH-like protein